MSNGRIPNDVIDSVLKRHDIVDVVGRYVHLTKQGHYLKGLCPFHSEKTPSFTVTPERQIFHCFGCGAGGSAIHFIMGVEGYSFGEAVRELAKEAGIEVGVGDEPSEQAIKQNVEKTSLLAAYEFTSKLYPYILKNTDEGKPAMNYLRSRGFSDKLIDTFQIGYAPPRWDTLAQLLEKRGFDLALMEKGGLLSARQEAGGYVDKFRDRIMFPICDAKGAVIAFGGRALGDVQPKYLNSPESILFNKSRTLYNFHMARPHIRKSGELVLFEGYVDVIKAWEAGVENGIATMGTALTDEQAKVIRNNAERVIVSYDGDNAGQNAAYKSIAILEKVGCQVKVAVLPSGLDPDEYIKTYGSERFAREIIEASVSSIKYKLLYFRKNYKLQEDGEKLRYIQHALKIVAGVTSPVEREHYVKELSSEFHYSYEILWQNLNEIRLQTEKNKNHGDNNAKPWNNVMNNGPVKERAPSLHPAYHNAEQKLLAVMMHDREISQYVEQHLGGQFHVEAHAALAAYLYSYYAQGNEPNVSSYISTLQDEGLVSAACFIADMGVSHATSEKVIDDYIKSIKQHYYQEELKRKEEARTEAERSGNVLLAAQIGLELIKAKRLLP
ncbi:DNA primase [Paenibacillus thalictri]|uniref:DNA primase n=1 Tax=Paenibacillus thalictri TaxID=2527873 RepID=A0A4Q9DP72_9BACL|nr:DNA primase [Paenibacillus thalictri]TBL78103.1 DNA primase [Paenibacillus thalictri]